MVPTTPIPSRYIGLLLVKRINGKLHRFEWMDFSLKSLAGKKD